MNVKELKTIAIQVDAEAASLYELASEEERRKIDELLSLRLREVGQSAQSLQPQRSILALDGLGKEIWQRIDAQTYVNQERDSWNG